MSSLKSIETFLSEPAIAVVGASRSGRKFGNFAARTLARKGYRVYLVHPGADVIRNSACYRRLSDLPERVNALFVSVPPEDGDAVLREAAAAGIRNVWVQQGVESRELEELGQELGLNVISGECILMFASPSGYHKFHQWCRQVRHRLPA